MARAMRANRAVLNRFFMSDEYLVLYRLTKCFTVIFII